LRFGEVGGSEVEDWCVTKTIVVVVGGGIKVCGGQGCWRGDEAEKISLSSEKKLFSHSFSR